MLTPATLLRSSVKATRKTARLGTQVQRRAGHGHDHQDLSHLERPTITPTTFSILAESQVSEADVQQWYSDSFNNGEWIVKFINSKTALKCLAEINGTEFHHPLKASTLIQVYKDQLATFEAQTAKALAKEGLPQKAIDRLHLIYSTRAHVDEWEVDAAIKRFSFLGKQQATYRVVSTGEDLWPTWKIKNTAPFLNNNIPRPQFLASEQAFGRFPATNEAAAVLNVIKFRGIVAFVNAVMRGLTPEERQKVRSVLVQPHIPIRLTDAQKAKINATIAEIRALNQDNTVAAEDKVKSLWASYNVNEKLYFHQQAHSILPKALVPHHDQDITHHEGEAETFLEEGIDYFRSEEDRQNALKKIKDYFFGVFDQNYKAAQASGDAATKTFADKFKGALNAFFTPEIQGDVELLTLMRGADLSERKLEEIFSIFRDNSDNSDHDLLMDAINPHPVSVRLFGERIRVLSKEAVEYTQNFHDGGDTNWLHENLYPKGTEELLTHDTFKAPPLPPNSYNTAMDEVLHLKLRRLATDFYGLDLDTDVGLATFDQLVHTFDISPGEETLDRTHPSPPDHHTYEELPILKYDGWDECDELPPESEVEALDVAVIEARINEWLEAVAKSQGTPYKSVKQLAEASSIDEVQLARLRAVLTYESQDRERIQLMKKIWSVVIPDKQLNLLFGEKEEKLIAAEHHH